MPKKIALVFTEFNYSGGVERVFAETLKFFHLQGWETTVICKNIDASLTQYSDHIIKLNSPKSNGFFGKILWMIICSYHAYKIKKNGDILVLSPPCHSFIVDIISTGSCHLASKFDELKNKRFRWIFNPENWLIFFCEFLAYNYLSKIIAVPSKRTGSEISRFFPFSTPKITVCPLGVDLNVFTPRKSGKVVSQKPLKLLTVTNEIERKGVLLVLHALKNLNDKGITISYSIIGRNIKEKHRNYVSKLGLDKTVKFYSPALQNELNIQYQNHDLFIFPTSYEAYGLVCAESICAGTPVISTKVGGIEDYVDSQETGIFIERDINSIERVISHLDENRNKIEIMQQNCIKKREEFKWSVGFTTLAKKIDLIFKKEMR